LGKTVLALQVNGGFQEAEEKLRQMAGEMRKGLYGGQGLERLM
jgi:hypothetical protein